MIIAATARITIIRRPVAAAIFFAFLTLFSPVEAKPRAVSLDYCADQFLLALADRDQIMALTTDAIESHSFYQKKAEGLPLFHATSEEVLHMRPDLVIRTWGGFTMLPFLTRAHMAVVSAEYGRGPDILYKNMRRIGAALQQSGRAEAMIQDQKARLRALKAKIHGSGHQGHKLRAAYITPGGVTAGANTSVNDIIKGAGLTSLAEEWGLTGWQTVPLEALIKNPPDIIIGSFFHQKNLHVSHWSLSRHDQIKKMLATIPTIMIPGRYLSCNGLFSIDASEYIHDRLEGVTK